MRGFSLFVFACMVQFYGYSQELPVGIWNAGRSFSIGSSTPEKLKLQKQVTLAEIYPGFAVIKNIYDVRHEEKDTLNVDFSWTDTTTTSDTFFGALHNLPSSGMKILMNSDTIQARKNEKGLYWSMPLAPSKITTIVTYQICPTGQAKLSREGGIREHNGLIISNGKWKPLVRQVLIDLKGDLKQIDLTAVYPSGIPGNRLRMIWQEQNPDSNLVIWYKGAAPDFKFDKKVVPQQAVLFDAIDDFNTGIFAEEAFSPITAFDFSTNTENNIAGFLYFALFTIPWILLAVFIFYLLKKPKS